MGSVMATRSLKSYFIQSFFLCCHFRSVAQDVGGYAPWLFKVNDA